METRKTRSLPPPSAGPRTNPQSPCKEDDTIYVESSIPMDDIADCLEVCQTSESCKFFTWNSGNCGIRSYSPNAMIKADQNQEIGTKTKITEGKGKVFVGKALKIQDG